MVNLLATERPTDPATHRQPPTTGATVTIEAATVEEALARLLADPAERERLGRRARQAFAALGGAAQANAEALEGLLAEAHP